MNIKIITLKKILICLLSIISIACISAPYEDNPNNSSGISEKKQDDLLYYKDFSVISGNTIDNPSYEYYFDFEIAYYEENIQEFDIKFKRKEIIKIINNELNNKNAKHLLPNNYEDLQKIIQYKINESISFWGTIEKILINNLTLNPPYTLEPGDTIINSSPYIFNQAFNNLRGTTADNPAFNYIAAISLGYLKEHERLMEEIIQKMPLLENAIQKYLGSNKANQMAASNWEQLEIELKNVVNSILTTDISLVLIIELHPF